MNTDELEPVREHAVDAVLRAAFTPPPAATFTAVARAAVDAAPERTGQRPRWPWLAAVAAMLVVALLLAVRPAQPVRGPEGHDGAELGAMWVAAYENALAQGFAGGGCCTPGVDLARTCEEKFASRLGLGPAGSVRLLGCYCGDRPTGGCMVLLARTAGEPVCVYVLPRQHDPHPRLPEGSTLRLARREMGRLVLYALSKPTASDTLGEFVVP